MKHYYLAMFMAGIIAIAISVTYVTTYHVGFNRGFDEAVKQANTIAKQDAPVFHLYPADPNAIKYPSFVDNGSNSIIPNIIFLPPDK